MPEATPVDRGTPILQLDQVVRSFGGVRAVDGCSFSIDRGSLTALIGPNGAGKSTVVNLVAGALKPDAGSIVYGGVDITGVVSHRIAGRGLIRTFQLSREFARMTVLENLVVVARGQSGESLFNALLRPRLCRREDRVLVERAIDVLDRFGLAAQRDMYAGDLSGGQKRLVELARAVMSEPELLILDEPMAGVNPALIDLLGGHIESLCRNGITVVMVEHNLEIVERICDHVVVMALGRTLATGVMSDLRSNSEVVRAYLGERLDEPTVR
ncbi:MAG: ABC transporter ATP-binding protein [Actinomycetes bacterium]